MSTTGSKDQRRELGQRGERLAEKYLRRKGFRLAKRNLRRKAGEIDLLMFDGDELVIIEVRTISRKGDLEIEERVPYRKRCQLVRLAHYLLAEIRDPLPPVRFDLCVVVLEPETEIHHFEDAFRESELTGGS